MLTRQELIQELVDGGLNYPAASSRVTVATRRLLKEGGFEPLHDKENNNKVSYTDEDAQKIRAKLGLTGQPKADPKPIEAEDVPAKTEDKPIETETGGESDIRKVISPGPKKAVDTLQDRNPPSPQSTEEPGDKSVRDLAQRDGPQNQQQPKKPDKPKDKPSSPEKAKKQFPWLFVGLGVLALAAVVYFIAQRKGGKKEAGKEEPEAIGPVAPVNLADQYRLK